MKTAFLALIAASCLVLPARAEGLTVAVVAPTDGPLAILGEQVRAGARAAAETSGARVVEITEACAETDGARIARDILWAGANAAIGFLCTDGLAAALPALSEAAVPAITLSVRSGILMEDALKKGWPLFRLAPGPKAEAEKVAEVIARDWIAEPFALIDDGTIHARELVEAVRLRLEEIGLKATFVDTYRPAQEQQLTLVRRLANTGVTRVFAGGDRADIAVIARDAAAGKAPFRIMGGEQLVAADPLVPMTDGVLAVALPDYALLAEGKPVAAALEDKGVIAEGYVLPAHAAVTLLAEAAKAGGDLLPALTGKTFDTAIGPVAFGADHELRENPYRLLEWREGAFLPVAEEAE